LRGRREEEESYRLLTGEIEGALTYLHSTKTTLRPALTLSLIDIRARTDPPGSFTDPGPNLIYSSIVWIHDERDNPLDPRRGLYTHLYWETGLPGFDPKRNYTIVEPEATYYLGALDPVILALLLRFGYGGPMDDALSLLPNKRFYAGGAASVRSYKRHMLGPKDDDDRPIGGITKAEGSFEARFPIFWRFSGVVFLDVGQVWLRQASPRVDELRFGIGPGLGLRTPVGPIRVDVGLPLGARERAQPDAVFHLSVGHAF
jgi:outer membrane translocation and assembly module TamA